MGRLRGSNCISMPKFVKNRSKRGRAMAIFRFFQDGGLPASWICNACVCTINEVHLVVFITVQNLVGIDAITCTGFDFAILASKRLYTPQNWEFWGFLTHKWGAMWKIPKRYIHARVRVVWAIMRENPPTGLTCRWVPQKRGINKNNFGYISPMCPQAPLVDGYAPNLAQP